MTEQSLHLQTTHPLSLNSRPELTGSEGEGETRLVEAVVVALIPRYHQVKVRDDHGHLYALTRRTRGVDLASLHEGQRLACTVTHKLPRVIAATTVA